MMPILPIYSSTFGLIGHVHRWSCRPAKIIGWGGEAIDTPTFTPKILSFRHVENVGKKYNVLEAIDSFPCAFKMS